MLPVVREALTERVTVCQVVASCTQPLYARKTPDSPQTSAVYSLVQCRTLFNVAPHMCSTLRLLHQMPPPWSTMVVSPGALLMITCAFVRGALSGLPCASATYTAHSHCICTFEMERNPRHHRQSRRPIRRHPSLTAAASCSTSDKCMHGMQCTIGLSSAK